MESDSSEKKHPPSQRKLKRAREKGDIPISRELVSAAVFFTAILLLGALASKVGQQLLELVRLCLSGEIEFHLVFVRLLEMVSVIVLPLLAVALFSSLSQNGFLFILRFDFARINPVRGLKNIFSKQRFLDLGLSFLKFLIVVVFSALATVSFTKKYFRVDVSLAGQALSVGKILFATLMTIAILGLVFGGLDFFLQRRRYLKRLGMSRQELLQELKEQEGDPHLKSERKRIHRQLSQAVGMGALARARLVVTNPTHIAVALAYRREVDQAPWVVVSGRDEKALLIRREALRLGIPVVEQVNLARSLIHLEWGEEIPEELYQATADVILALEEAEAQSGRKSDHLD